jgi:Flp pilus assembly protein TadG
MTSPLKLVVRLSARFVAEEDSIVGVVVALALVALMGFTALVLDAGFLFVERTQMQKAADAAALAGAFDIWPGDGTNGSVSANSAADATKYLKANGMDPSSDLNLSWVTAAGGQSATVYDPGDAWKVSISRRVPLVFAPVLGIPTATVTVSALAINSPLSECDDACVLPYAIWGGNTTQDRSGGGVADRWCAGVQPPNYPSSVPAPCSTPAWATGQNWSIPGSQQAYNYHFLTTQQANGQQLVYRDNSWTGDIVFPDPGHCGGNNQLPCSNNWQGSGSNSFNGFFNNITAPLTTNSTGTFATGGNGTGNTNSNKEPWTRICNLATTNGDGIFPLVDQMTAGNGGNYTFHIVDFIALKLQAPNGCSGGNQMGQSNFTGTVDWGAVIPHGQGQGPASSPVHVLQLWQ